MSEAERNFIGGSWRPSQTGETFEVVDPARTDEVVATIPLSDESDATTGD